MGKWKTTWKRKAISPGWYNQNRNMGKWKYCLLDRRRSWSSSVIDKIKVFNP